MKPIQFLMMSLSLCSALTASTALANTGNAPSISIGTGVQSGAADGMRGLIKVSYSGKAVAPQNCTRCAPGWRGCGEATYFAVSAQMGLVQSGNLSSMDITILPISGQETYKSRYRRYYEGAPDQIMDFAALPVQISREVALGKDAKVRIDLVGIASTWQERGSDALSDFFVTVSANILGAQYLRATGYVNERETLAQSFYGLDLGDVGGEVGMSQYWTQGFRTRITVGAKAAIAAGWSDAQGATLSTEIKEYARISAILDTNLAQIEAYAEGAATQMALGDEVRSNLQMEFGALARF